LQKENKLILKNISLTFESGKKYLIIGRNGSGKSSFLRLLKGYDTEYTGNIFVNGLDLQNINSSSLAKSIIYINEQVSLFCDSVLNNITMYKDYSKEDIDDAIYMSGLKVPLDRIVSDGEINLSSGERRRIELARAYLSKAQMLIFDEAVSTLDIKTAYNIEKTMLDMKDRTVVFVSHNFSNSLIKKYDSIILISNGEIVDQGTHEQLMHSSEMYRNIIKIKSGV
jgi:ATP-binding cassette subfamily C protein